MRHYNQSGHCKRRLLVCLSKIPEISVGNQIKWKGPFRFLPTGIFGITSGGGPLISVAIYRPKFAVPFLTNRFFAIIREFGKGIKSGKSHSYWLAGFNRKLSFRFPSVFPLISDRSVWHNGKHPLYYFLLNKFEKGKEGQFQEQIVRTQKSNRRRFFNWLTFVAFIGLFRHFFLDPLTAPCRQRMSRVQVRGMKRRSE